MPDIIRITSYDLLYTDVTPDTYYYVTDSNILYYDQKDSKRAIVPFVFVETELQRTQEIIPLENLNYYVWETNELWTWSTVWIIKAGSENKNWSYYHGVQNKIYALDTGYEDNNGLLGDGSVVIRDVNKAIKGRMYVDLETNNLVLSSFLGGGLTLLPYGVTDTIVSVQDPVFKYVVDSDGNYVLDENGNRQIEKVEVVPEYTPTDVGRLDIDIFNKYAEDGSVQSREAVMKFNGSLRILGPIYAKNSQGEEVQINKIENIKGDPGTTFIPSVSDDGILSWSNGGGLENPPSVNVRGSKGDSPKRGIDYWTTADIAEMKSYIDSAILGGKW